MGFRHVTTGAVAIAVAAAVLSACGSSVSGEASSTTATRSVTPKAATVSGVAPKLAGPGPVGELQDVTGQGNLLKGLDGQQYALRPEPGVKVSSKVGGCTLGPAIKAAGRTGFLVAEHCDGKHNEAGMQYARINAEAKNPLPLAAITDTDKVTDSGVIWTPEAADDTKLAGVWSVRGALSMEQLADIPEGAPVCMNASVSGVICGGKIASGETGVAILKPVQPRDSGSAAFVVDAAGGAWIVGVLSTGTSTSIVMPVEPMLKRLHASVITA